MDFENSEIALQKESESEFSLTCSGELVGKVELYCNKFHNRSQYLRLHLPRYEKAWAAPLFSQLQITLKKPMQVMLSSDDTEQIDFLLAGGFSCKRKCYEMEVTANNFLQSRTAAPLEITVPGQSEYTSCCQLLYDYYKVTHAEINPLTADFVDFCEILPVEVCFEKKDGQIRHIAFIEENEIAYIASTDIDNIQSFAASVVSRLFSQYESIYFECDDCDAAAMALKGLFYIEAHESYDTYSRNL